MMPSYLQALSDFSLSIPAVASALGKPRLDWLVHANGDADFHDNIILFGFGDREPDPVLVAKVPRLTGNGWMLKVEHDRLIELCACLGEDSALYVPRPLALATVQDWPALLLSYVKGQSLTRLSSKSFWKNSRKVRQLANDAARALRYLHDRTSTPLSPDEMHKSDFDRPANRFRELFQLSDREDQALTELADLVRSTRRESSHKVLLQGDFWHGNMIRDKRHNRLRFLDWQFARWSRDASLDVYFFLLAGAFSATRDDGPVERRAAGIHRLLSSWSSQVIPEYLTAYGTPSKHALLAVKSGMLLCCIEKAVRPSLDFGYRHPDDSVWRHLFAELLDWPEGG